MITNHWVVSTPTYNKYYGEYEPPESTCDYVTVIAETKKEALVKGVRELRANDSEWLDGANNPFTGLKAEKFVCEHGYCWCEICGADKSYEECPQCLAEWEKEDNGNIRS